jgi:hypothetical protein
MVFPGRDGHEQHQPTQDEKHPTNRSNDIDNGKFIIAQIT